MLAEIEQLTEMVVDEKRWAREHWLPEMQKLIAENDELRKRLK